LRDQLEQGLLADLPGTHVFTGNLPTAQRLPNTSYLRFGHVHADAVLGKLDRLGIMASSGSACSSGGNEPSPVLLAMGVSREEALCAIRLTLSDTTTAAEIQAVLNLLPPELAPLMQAAQASAPASPSSPSTTGVFA
jgi:cysteine desulfurase